MFWFLFCVTVLCLMDPKECRASRVTSPVLEMPFIHTGFDPVTSNILLQPDPAVRGQIFESIPRPTYSAGGTRAVKPFMNVIQETECIPKVVTHAIRNYDEYKRLVSTSFSFATPEDSITNGENDEFDFAALAGYGSEHHEAVVAIQQHFKQTGGEMIIASAECVTHTVSVDPFQPPIFTTAFQIGMARLALASLDPSSDTSDRVFAEFVRTYGTHFSRMTLLGAKILLGKLFSGRTYTARDRELRRRCMTESAYETLTPDGRWNNETIHLHFSRLVSDKCGSEDRDVVVVANGPLPEVSLRDWSSSAKLNPRPIYSKLQKISVMFRSNWPASVFEQIMRSSAKINYDEMDLFQYFENKTLDYCSLLLNQSCQPLLLGCGFNSLCPVGSTCIDQPNTKLGYVCSAKYGGIVIVGSGTNAAYRSEAWGAAEPVFFPRTVVGNTVTIVSKTIYSCGGDSHDGRLCYYLRADDTAWTVVSLPWQLFGHCAVAISDEIWFFLNSKLHVYHTKNERKHFEVYNLVFSFTTALCAVTNNSHTLLIGAGANSDEIWMNTDSSKPSQWAIFDKLPNSRVEHACVWVDEEIFVTGGRTERKGDSSALVEILNVATNMIQSISPMVQTRRDHQMAVIYNKPAVIAGIDVTGGATKTIETYDATTDTWQILDYTLNDIRSTFGLAQYRV